MKLATALSVIILAQQQVEAHTTSIRREQQEETCQTIAEIACNTEGFSMLCSSLEKTGLDKVLGGTDPFTVFAPTDEAFAKLGADVVEGLDADALSDILLFHATAGEILFDDLVCQALVPMANGKDSRTYCQDGDRFQKGSGNPIFNMPMIITPDLMACNGCIHVVDEVMMPSPPPPDCHNEGFSRFPNLGDDSSQRLLLREGIIEEIPSSLCPKDRVNATSKNVILVIGDGMGWEMVRSGAIARRVLDELADLGCDAVSGECPDDLKESAKKAFAGRTTADYYTEGAGSGLSFQEALDFMLMTTTTTVIQEPEPGNHYAPASSMLEGLVGDHFTRQAPLALNECGFPIDFSPLDWEIDGGNMVLWDDVMGGEFPWDERYYQENPDFSTGFDPTYIMQHATDSASTAGTMATGHKAANNMVSVNLYEEDVSTLVEEAMMCGMAGGVVTSVPLLHATPAAFITHTNNRSNRDSLRRSFERVMPTFASGVCGGDYYPYPETLQSMRDGALSSQWTFLEQNENITAEEFYAGERFTSRDPDNGDHVLVCLGGDFSASGESNLPFRGVDSSFSNRWCSEGEALIDPDTGDALFDPETGDVLGVNVTTPSEPCNHYEPEEIAVIPHISDNVKAALDFLSKDDDGFFLMYEQGDIDWAAHANHMDDMLGAMLDIDDSVQVILDWIADNGGWEKNALYVTADHDHYVTLLDDFPETLAMLLIDGMGHMITPQSNSDVNPWEAAIDAGVHLDDSKTQIEHIKDFTTWSEEDIVAVSHFFGPRGSGGNGWGSHSTRPVPLYYAGDDGCLEALLGADFQVLGRTVNGAPGKVDQMHLHACMQKQKFGL